MSQQLFFNRETKTYHFCLHDKKRKFIGHVLDTCSPFSIGDTFKKVNGNNRGTYEIKSVSDYNNVECVLISDNF